MLNTYLHLSKKDYIERWSEVKEFFHDWESEAFDGPIRDLIKHTLENAMQAELVGHLKAKPQERVKERLDYRNGSYLRDLVTKYGLIRFLSVPRARQRVFRTKVFRRYKRRWQVVDDYLCHLFIEGVSTREVGAVVSELLDIKPSATVISNVSKALGEEVRRFHCRRIADDYSHLFLDGVWVKVNGYKVVKKVLLIAYGIRRNGVREIIGFRLAKSESERDWEVFLQDLYRRGLEGEYLRMITIDGGKGLRSALERIYPHITLQRCWVHKLRNVTRHLSVKYRGICLKGARAVYLASNKQEAIKRFREWAKAWGNIVPKAVSCLEEDLEDLLNFFKEPEILWSKIRTTNAIERLFRELRKRIRPMCSFKNSESCERITLALFNKYNNKWKDRPLKALKELTQKY